MPDERFRAASVRGAGASLGSFGLVESDHDIGAGCSAVRVLERRVQLRFARKAGLRSIPAVSTAARRPLADCYGMNRIQSC